MANLKNVLVVGGGILQVRLIEEAKKMGLFTIAMDKNKNAPGMKIADEKIVEDIANHQEAAKRAFAYHQQRKISVVVTVGTDFTYTVNAIKKKIKLPSLPKTKSQLFTNKLKMRKFLKKQNFPQPNFVSLKEEKNLKKINRHLNFPIVIKPVDSMGARGVVKIEKNYNTEKNLKQAFYQAREFSLSQKVIAEEIIAGKEFSIDALIHNGKVIICGFADRIIEFPPYFVETSHVIPSQEKTKVVNKIQKEFIKVVQSFQLIDGAVKGDVFYNDDGKVVIGEIANRLSGGFMSTHTYPLASGVNLMHALLSLHLKLPFKLQEDQKKIVVEKAILLQEQKKMVFKKVSGLRKVLKIPQVKNIFFYIQAGETITPPKNNLMKIASIIIAGDSILELNKIIKTISEMVKINNQSIYFPLIKI